MINSVNNDVSFKGVKLYFISRNSKTGKAILDAAKSPLRAKQIEKLEKQGLFFDIVREFDRMGKRTDCVSFNLKRKPDYHTKDGMMPKYFALKVTNLKEAKLFIRKAIKKSKEFLSEHFKYVENIQARKSTFHIGPTYGEQANPVENGNIYKRMQELNDKSKQKKNKTRKI